MELQQSPVLPFHTTIPSKRMPFIDELRGFCILYVMLYHLLYDIDTLFAIAKLPFFWSTSMQFSRIIVVMTLMVLSGISCTLSKNNIKRAFRLLGVAALITLVTYQFLGNNYILFGILHFFAAAILIYCVIGKWVKKLPRKTFSLVFLILFLAGFTIYDGYINLLGYTLMLPDFLYNKLWLLPIGFGLNGFSSVDYYPLLPWLFIFFIGVLWGDYIKQKNAPSFLYKEHCYWLGVIGRHTLLLYLLHQPLFYGVLWLITYQINLSL